MKLRLVDDWHQAWKWSSMRFLGLSGFAELVLKFYKDIPQEVSQYIEPKVLSYIATGSFILAALGRITQVDKHDDTQQRP